MRRRSRPARSLRGAPNFLDSRQQIVRLSVALVHVSQCILLHIDVTSFQESSRFGWF